MKSLKSLKQQATATFNASFIKMTDTRFSMSLTENTSLMMLSVSATVLLNKGAIKC